MSETFKTSFDPKPHKENYYNLFSGINIPQDFFQTIQQEAVITKATVKVNEEEGFFKNDQIENMKKVENQIDQYPNNLAPKSPIYYINASPPGITPPKHLIYQQKQSSYPSQNNQSLQQFSVSKNQDSELKIFTKESDAMTQQLKQLLQIDQQAQASTQIENAISEPVQEQNSLYAKRTGASKIPMLKTTISTTEQLPVGPQIQFHQQYQENEDFQPTTFSPQAQQQQYQQFPNQYQQQQQYATQQKMLNYYQQQQQQQQNYQKGFQQNSGKKLPVILDESKVRHEGYLKFFDEGKNYGFLVMDSDKSDIFVHFDDLQKIGITKEFLKTTKSGNIIRFSFCCLAYMGKYNRSRKAVDLELLPCSYD